MSTIRGTSSIWSRPIFAWTPRSGSDLLELDSVREKLARSNSFIAKELDVLELGKKIQSDVQEELGKNQREFYLREQLKAIQRELGEGTETEAEATELRQKIEDSGMPEEAAKEARRELDRLSKLPPAAAEYGVIKTYLDWLTSLPWNSSTEGEIDVAKARQILDDEHYDLEKIKDRILEYLAVRKLKQEAAIEAGRARTSTVARADPLLRRTSGRRQDESGAVDRARPRPRADPNVARRSP